MSEIKIALIADIHNGPDQETKRGSTAIPLLQKYGGFLKRLNPDFVVDLGDRIIPSDEQEDRTKLREITDALHSLGFPLHHIVGNDDIQNLSVEQHGNILGCNLHSRSLDYKDHHFVFWNHKANRDAQHGFVLDDDDLEWLSTDLANTTFPTIIFSHMPLDNGSIEGNFYYELSQASQYGFTPAEGRRIREVIECTGNVVLCVNGHTHWNAYHCIDGIHYVTIPSYTESFMTWPEPSAAHACLTIAGPKMFLEIYGLAPMRYELPMRNMKLHWCSRSKGWGPPYADMSLTKPEPVEDTTGLIRSFSNTPSK